jgi:hypothetical protein
MVGNRVGDLRNHHRPRPGSGAIFTPDAAAIAGAIPRAKLMTIESGLRGRDREPPP